MGAKEIVCGGWGWGVQEHRDMENKFRINWYCPPYQPHHTRLLPCTADITSRKQVDKTHRSALFPKPISPLKVPRRLSFRASLLTCLVMGSSKPPSLRTPRRGSSVFVEGVGMSGRGRALTGEGKREEMVAVKSSNLESKSENDIIAKSSSFQFQFWRLG